MGEEGRLPAMAVYEGRGAACSTYERMLMPTYWTGFWNWTPSLQLSDFHSIWPEDSNPHSPVLTGC